MVNSYCESIKNELIEIHQSRNIIKSMVIKDLIGRYKNSFLGFSWHFIVPMMMLIIYYTVFTQLRSHSIPEFWIYIASGLFPFTFMISNLIGGSDYVISNAASIKKMYFPRSIVVISKIISTFIIMIIGYVIVLTAIILTGHQFGPGILTLPVIMTLMVMFVLGYALFFSSITVYVRDIRHFFSSISMVFFFCTPMYFLSSEINGVLKMIVMFNPFTYYIETFHQITYFNSLPSIEYLVICSILSLLSLGIGTVTFHKLKRGFVERL